MTGKLAVIIPAFSGLEQTRSCLQSLGASHYRDFEVILIDHGASDALSEMAGNEFPEVTCLRGSSDLWWSGASNLGIRHALEVGSPRVMLLNHDCYVEPDTIGTLLKAAEEDDNTIIAPVQHVAGTGRTIIGMTSCFLLGFPTIIPPAAWYRLRYPSGLVPTALIGGGRGVIIHTETFQRVGLLDEEQLPHYYADHDFYFRCRKAGMRLYICTETRINIDDRMTSSADTTGFRHALKDRGSHRNIRDLQVLFSRYYPIPGLARVGVALNAVRFFLVILGKKLTEE